MTLKEHVELIMRRRFPPMGIEEVILQVNLTSNWELVSIISEAIGDPATVFEPPTRGKS